MFNKKNYPNLDIPKKIVFCPLTGNINARVFNAFSITSLIDQIHWKNDIKVLESLVGDK